MEEKNDDTSRKLTTVIEVIEKAKLIKRILATANFTSVKMDIREENQQYVRFLKFIDLFARLVWLLTSTKDYVGKCLSLTLMMLYINI